MRNRLTEEKIIVELMIRAYCQHKERNDELCCRCAELLDYAFRRLDSCKYGISKPTCRLCPIHCYREDMQDRIRTVMRWSGPRMILYHPMLAARHLLKEIRDRHFSNTLRL